MLFKIYRQRMLKNSYKLDNACLPQLVNAFCFQLISLHRWHGLISIQAKARQWSHFSKIHFWNNMKCWKRSFTHERCDFMISTNYDFLRGNDPITLSIPPHILTQIGTRRRVPSNQLAMPATPYVGPTK